jgi:hypothetical protein
MLFEQAHLHYLFVTSFNAEYQIDKIKVSGIHLLYGLNQISDQ